MTIARRVVHMPLAIVPALMMAGCATTAVSPAQNVAGYATVELDPATRGPVAGVGIEGQDVVSMTDQMVREMLANPTLARPGQPAQVIVDGEYFTNESSQRINKNIITDRLRVNLNRAAQGRMVFVSRQSAGMVATERDLKRQGVTDQGTAGLTQAQAGGDYRLRGNIASIDALNGTSGMQQRYNLITFEMIDLERGTIVWSGSYEIERAAADDIVYR